MNRILKILPELRGEEHNLVGSITRNLTDEDLEAFANIYRVRRKDPQSVLIMALVGLFVIPGLQRFYLEQIGMGLLYLFTLGLCLVGSILDLVNHQKLALEYNQGVATEVIAMIRN